MSWSFPLAQVKGIKIQIHATFVLVLIWAALEWGVTRGLGPTGALYGIVFTSLLFVCVTLHELAHSLVAIHYGVRVRDITLLPIGGLARLEGELKRPAHEFWVAISGPASNSAREAWASSFSSVLPGKNICLNSAKIKSAMIIASSVSAACLMPIPVV